MSLSTAKKIVDFIFENQQEHNQIDIGFFGGEPLLEYELLKNITSIVQSHKAFHPKQVKLSVTTNGTLLTREIMTFLLEKNIALFISCDGPPKIQDQFRHFSNGKKTSDLVEKNIMEAANYLPVFGVNSVYSPENFEFLPDVVDYFLTLGVKMLYLSPNISAQWTKKEADMIHPIYDAVGKRYVNSFSSGKPVYISLIDSKITVILKGGYEPSDMCRMGRGEYAFAPSGNVYTCERLIGSDDGITHCLGNIDNGLFSKKGCGTPEVINVECLDCSLKKYCMNWCGCTNYYSSQSYNRVSPFTCLSEKAAIRTALDILQNAENHWLPNFSHMQGQNLPKTSEKNK